MGFMIIVFQIIVILFSVVLHELSHGVVANSLGDPTAKNQGRLTLNPLKHLDLFGSVILPILFIIASSGLGIGRFVFGYAKPVPYNPNNLRDKKWGTFKVALAGPLSNIILAVIFGVLWRVLAHTPLNGNSNLFQLFGYIVWMNILLAIFNIIPIPPLDGHWLLFTFLSSKYDAFKYFLLRYSMIIFVLFIFFIFPLFYPLINFLFGLIIGTG
ncbi:MAG: peptidase M50 [Parcubacteria group bacterium Licking1014_17]|nr:MAG: peptidase M50 [Parcubacteria group bacterium Licking1014_17]